MTRDLLLVGLSMLTWGLGEGMFYIFQPLYLQQWGAKPVEIGAILSAVGISMVFVQAPAGYVADRIGPRLVMWFSWALGLVATALMAWSRSLEMFVAGMLVYGVTSLAVSPMSSYITHVRGSFSVERALTINSAMYYLGAIAGPIIGGQLGNRLGLQAVYRISVVIFAISTLIIFFIRHTAPQHHIATDHTGPRLLNNRRFLLFLGMAFLILFAAYLPQPLTANYLENQRKLDYSAIGILSSVGNASNMVISLLFGGLNALWGLVIGEGLLCLFALLMWRGDNLLWFVLAYAFIGGYRLVRLLLLAFSRPLVNLRQMGLAFGLIETMNAVAVILAPLAAGLLYNSNPTSVYTVSFATLAVILLLSVFFLPQLQKHPKDKEQVEEITVLPLEQ